MRRQCATKVKHFAVLLGAALCVATVTHANAGVWMMLGDGGKLESGRKPNRVMHYADASDRRDRSDQNAKIAEIMRDSDPKTIDARVKAMEVMEMDVFEIYEHPTAPGLKKLTMQFQCASKRYKVVKAEAKERNSLHHFSGGTDWQEYVPTDWQSRAYFVACFPEVWQPLAQADVDEQRKTTKAANQAALREYGVGVIGYWGTDEGINKVYRLTWDKVWVGDATPVPFHHNRTAAEEKEYQAWKKGNDAVVAENLKNAPMVSSAIGALEGQITGELKGLDDEKAFQDDIAKNFKKHSSTYYGTFRGLTEEQVVDVRGAPTSVSTHDTLRLLAYAYVQDTRQEVTIRDGKGNPVGSDVIGQVLGCAVTFKLRVGGNSKEYRVVDYQVKRDITSQGYGQCD